ncbi:bis(5'-nucleosyl)-tetraphosphatase [Lactiplantibacillus fabifermentans]|uniref:Bis(5'-nucleosyl)-tetraphosphatase [asymmetrical] n=1 Tax=Lactiplantibacillus fabifermentans T30PCM01 TaxID=1400520 RepID=W6T971_9LACO|nr:bis(5'-nucleosyl)-tetraphosphatase [Lactiplantibacillus fabifermentans]ETY75021.1 NUDIX hydrolase [Lactiplantibacillus fabifermentans T30PCM01]
MSTEVASGAVVYQQRDGHPAYLLLQSATSDFWGFPKGHLEGNETLPETAVREIHEETQIDATLDTNFKAYTEYDLPNGNLKQVTLFVSEVPTGVAVTRQVEEISAIGWFDYATARKRLTYDNLKELLDQANDYIEKKLAK